MKKLVVALLFVVGCSPSPKEVVAELDAALATKNLDQAMMLLAEEVRLTVDGKTVTGKEAVKMALEGIMAKNPKTTLMGEHMANGNTVTWTEKVTTDHYTMLGLEGLEAKNEAMVEMGLIKAMTRELTPEANEKLQAAIAESHKKLAMELDALMNAKNVEGLMALFHTDAVMSTPVATWTGAAELKDGLTALMAKNIMVTPAEYQVAGDKVTWLAKIRSDELAALKLDNLDTKAELTVADGKVKSFTTVYTAEAAKKLQEATATASAAPMGKGAKKHKK